MECRKVYHVTTNGSNGWKSMMENTGRPCVTGINKQDVVNRTVEIAKHHTKCSVIIHKQDGTIQEERTYPRSSDPHASLG